MFNRDAWGFHKRLIHEYGPVSVVRGLLGVCAQFRPVTKRYPDVSLQERMIYVFDPKAMHNIIVKDQYIYEETPVFLK